MTDPRVKFAHLLPLKRVLDQWHIEANGGKKRRGAENAEDQQKRLRRARSLRRELIAALELARENSSIEDALNAFLNIMDLLSENYDTVTDQFKLRFTPGLFVRDANTGLYRFLTFNVDAAEPGNEIVSVLSTGKLVDGAGQFTDRTTLPFADLRPLLFDNVDRYSGVYLWLTIGSDNTEVFREFERKQERDLTPWDQVQSLVQTLRTFGAPESIAELVFLFDKIADAVDRARDDQDIRFEGYFLEIDTALDGKRYIVPRRLDTAAVAYELEIWQLFDAGEVGSFGILFPESDRAAKRAVDRTLANASIKDKERRDKQIERILRFRPQRAVVRIEATYAPENAEEQFVVANTAFSLADIDTSALARPLAQDAPDTQVFADIMSAEQRSQPGARELFVARFVKFIDNAALPLEITVRQFGATSTERFFAASQRIAGEIIIRESVRGARDPIVGIAQVAGAMAPEQYFAAQAPPQSLEVLAVQDYGTTESFLLRGTGDEAQAVDEDEPDAPGAQAVADDTEAEPNPPALDAPDAEGLQQAGDLVVTDVARLLAKNHVGALYLKYEIRLQNLFALYSVGRLHTRHIVGVLVEFQRDFADFPPGVLLRVDLLDREDADVEPRRVFAAASGSGTALSGLDKRLGAVIDSAVTDSRDADGYPIMQIRIRHTNGKEGEELENYSTARKIELQTSGILTADDAPQDALAIQTRLAAPNNEILVGRSYEKSLRFLSDVFPLFGGKSVPDELQSGLFMYNGYAFETMLQLAASAQFMEHPDLVDVITQSPQRAENEEHRVQLALRQAWYLAHSTGRAAELNKPVGQIVRTYQEAWRYRLFFDAPLLEKVAQFMQTQGDRQLLRVVQEPRLVDSYNARAGVSLLRVDDVFTGPRSPALRGALQITRNSFPRLAQATQNSQQYSPRDDAPWNTRISPSPYFKLAARGTMLSPGSRELAAQARVQVSVYGAPRNATAPPVWLFSTPALALRGGDIEWPADALRESDDPRFLFDSQDDAVKERLRDQLNTFAVMRSEPNEAREYGVEPSLLSGGDRPTGVAALGEIAGTGVPDVFLRVTLFGGKGRGDDEEIIFQSARFNPAKLVDSDAGLPAVGIVQRSDPRADVPTGARLFALEAANDAYALQELRCVAQEDRDSGLLRMSNFHFRDFALDTSKFRERAKEVEQLRLLSRVYRNQGLSHDQVVRAVASGSEITELRVEREREDDYAPGDNDGGFDFGETFVETRAIVRAADDENADEDADEDDGILSPSERAIVESVGDLMANPDAALERLESARSANESAADARARFLENDLESTLRDPTRNPFISAGESSGINVGTINEVDIAEQSGLASLPAQGIFEALEQIEDAQQLLVDFSRLKEQETVAAFGASKEELLADVTRRLETKKQALRRRIVALGAEKQNSASTAVSGAAVASSSASAAIGAQFLASGARQKTDPVRKAPDTDLPSADDAIAKAKALTASARDPRAIFDFGWPFRAERPGDQAPFVPVDKNENLEDVLRNQFQVTRELFEESGVPKKATFVLEGVEFTCVHEYVVYKLYEAVLADLDSKKRFDNDSFVAKARTAMLQLRKAPQQATRTKNPFRVWQDVSALRESVAQLSREEAQDKELQLRAKQFVETFSREFNKSFRRWSFTGFVAQIGQNAELFRAATRSANRSLATRPNVSFRAAQLDTFRPSKPGNKTADTPLVAPSLEKNRFLAAAYKKGFSHKQPTFNADNKPRPIPMFDVSRIVFGREKIADDVDKVRGIYRALNAVFGGALAFAVPPGDESDASAYTAADGAMRFLADAEYPLGAVAQEVIAIDVAELSKRTKPQKGAPAEVRKLMSAVIVHVARPSREQDEGEATGAAPLVLLTRETYVVATAAAAEVTQDEAVFFLDSIDALPAYLKTTLAKKNDFEQIGGIAYLRNAASQHPGAVRDNLAEQYARDIDLYEAAREEAEDIERLRLFRNDAAYAVARASRDVMVAGVEWERTHEVQIDGIFMLRAAPLPFLALGGLRASLQESKLSTSTKLVRVAVEVVPENGTPREIFTTEWAPLFAMFDGRLSVLPYAVLEQLDDDDADPDADADDRLRQRNDLAAYLDLATFPTKVLEWEVDEKRLLDLPVEALADGAYTPIGGVSVEDLFRAHQQKEEFLPGIDANNDANMLLEKSTKPEVFVSEDKMLVFGGQKSNYEKQNVRFVVHGAFLGKATREGSERETRLPVREERIFESAVIDKRTFETARNITPDTAANVAAAGYSEASSEPAYLDRPALYRDVADGGLVDVLRRFVPGKVTNEDYARQFGVYGLEVEFNNNAYNSVELEGGETVEADPLRVTLGAYHVLSRRARDENAQIHAQAVASGRLSIVAPGSAKPDDGAQPVDEDDSALNEDVSDKLPVGSVYANTPLAAGSAAQVAFPPAVVELLYQLLKNLTTFKTIYLVLKVSPDGTKRETKLAVLTDSELPSALVGGDKKFVNKTRLAKSSHVIELDGLSYVAKSFSAGAQDTVVLRLSADRAELQKAFSKLRTGKPWVAVTLRHSLLEAEYPAVFEADGKQYSVPTASFGEAVRMLNLPFDSASVLSSFSPAELSGYSVITDKVNQALRNFKAKNQPAPGPAAEPVQVSSSTTSAPYTAQSSASTNTFTSPSAAPGVVTDTELVIEKVPKFYKIFADLTTGQLEADLEPVGAVIARQFSEATRLGSPEPAVGARVAVSRKELGRVYRFGEATGTKPVLGFFALKFEVGQTQLARFVFDYAADSATARLTSYLPFARSERPGGEDLAEFTQ